MQQDNPPATDRLVDEHGRVHFGRFEQTPAWINGRSADLLSAMGRPAGRLMRRFGYKQFQYFGLISDRFLLGCALADTAWLGVAFVYLYDASTGQLREWSWQSPLARALTLSDSPRQGRSRFHKSGVDIHMGYDAPGDRLVKWLTIDLPDLQLQASLHEGPEYRPMSLCTRTGVNGFAFANKVAGVAVTGQLTWRGEAWSLESLSARGHHDFTAGYLRRETYWNWACTSTRVDGHDVGLNLSCGVNETSFSENCLWVDGDLIEVGGVHFEYDRRQLFQPWRISDTTGRVDLTFRPGGCHEQCMNLGVFASNFHQLFGRFEGGVHTGRSRLDLTGVHGFVEEQFARW